MQLAETPLKYFLQYTWKGKWKDTQNLLCWLLEDARSTFICHPLNIKKRRRNTGSCGSRENRRHWRWRGKTDASDKGVGIPSGVDILFVICKKKKEKKRWIAFPLVSGRDWRREDAETLELALMSNTRSFLFPQRALYFPAGYYLLCKMHAWNSWDQPPHESLNNRLTTQHPAQHFNFSSDCLASLVSRV